MIKDTDEALPLGTEVHSRYRTLAIVGRGGVGTVYKVADIRTGGTYALKELANTSASARKQFENEAQWLRALDHPNIPKVREYFEWESRVYLVMDFVDGENLEQKLVRGGGRPLDEAQLIAWILPICDALAYLHAQQPPILHRDVKPANIIVTLGGYPVLVDLGIAKEHLPGAGQTATFVKKAGTEGYAPPEQYTTSGKTGPWSDVYGMGATLYELLTGTLPPTAVERVALDSPMLRPRTINPALSVQVDETITRALALRPADRFQSMADLARALGGSVRRSDPALNPVFSPLPASGPLASGPLGGMPGSYPSMPASGPSMSFDGPIGPGSGGPSNAIASLPTLDPPTLGVPTPVAPFSSPSSPSGVSYPARGAVLPPREGESSTGKLRRMASVAVEPTEQAESSRASGRASRRGSVWVVGIIAALLLLAIAGGAIALYAVGPFAAPDRSTPQATVKGYFAALSAQDYARAWQYSAATHNAPGTQTTFTANLKADDDSFGRVTSAHIASIQQGSVGSAQATVAVQRANVPARTMTYMLVLTLYDGGTWLIESVSVS